MAQWTLSMELFVTVVWRERAETELGLGGTTRERGGVPTF